MVIPVVFKRLRSTQICSCQITDRKSVASCADDGTVQVWQFKADMRPLKYPHKEPIHAVAYNDDGTYLASGGSEGKVYVTRNNAKNEGISFKGHSAV